MNGIFSDPQTVLSLWIKFITHYHPFIILCVSMTTRGWWCTTHRSSHPSRQRDTALCSSLRAFLHCNYNLINCGRSFGQNMMADKKLRPSSYLELTITFHVAGQYWTGTDHQSTTAQKVPLMNWTCAANGINYIDHAIHPRRPRTRKWTTQLSKRRSGGLEAGVRLQMWRVIAGRAFVGSVSFR